MGHAAKAGAFPAAAATAADAATAAAIAARNRGRAAPRIAGCAALRIAASSSAAIANRRARAAPTGRRNRSIATATGNAERGDRRNAERGDRGNRGDRGSYETFDSRRYTNRSRESADNRRYDHNRATYGGRTPYYHNGRVSHFQRYGNGYRVWIGGATYPFFVPLSYWDPWRFRVGVSINLGGWWNPLGYYDYYDGYTDGYRDSYYRNDDYRDGRVYRTEQISGRVEDYDYRRRVALIRDDVTDRLVTVYMHSRDARLNHLRPGDYIEIEGGWKNGIFEAYRVFDVD
jgi:hypothetical protein